MKRIIVVAWVACVFMLSGLAPAQAQAYPGTLTGTLNILNAGDVPAGAVIVINLLQQFNDLRPFALGTQTITVTKALPAMPYEITYDPALVDAKGQYYVDAMIFIGNDIRWVTTGDSAVLTRGAPVDRMDLRLVPLRGPAPAAQQNTGESMLDVLKGNGNFGTLISLASDAGLSGALESGNAQTTLFAPTDDAFERLPAGALDKLRKNKPQLRRVLLYHWVAGKWLSAAVKLRTALNTQDARRRILIRPVNEVIRINNRAVVVQPDLLARNGVIHAISEVLLPPK
jgi:uncharacterized surface protein with fasciclin (FAS1) repeats/uncharacterized lipoprotein YbaY